jgi:hypothetical protein
MADKAQTPDTAPGGEETPPPTPPKRSPGHRGADVRDTVAEMTARAHEISLEAGSKMAGAMKDVINAAAGLAGFAMESARDLVQYMVRRGQMTQDEADRLLRDAEEAQARRKPPAPPAAPAAAPPSEPKAAVKKPAAKSAAEPAAPPAAASAPTPPAAKKSATKTAAAKSAPAKSAEKRPAAKTDAAKKGSAAKPPAKAAAKKSAAKKR